MNWLLVGGLLLIALSIIIGVIYAMSSGKEGPVPLNGTKASELGDFPMAPWGGAANFSDTSAKWIWNTSNAAAGAPAGVVKFSNQYYNASGSPVSTTLHMIVDDGATISINGSQVADVPGGGWANANYPKRPVTFVAGNNLIEISATNGGGPAGTIFSFKKDSDNTVLIKSDSTWTVL